MVCSVGATLIGVSNFMKIYAIMSAIGKKIFNNTLNFMSTNLEFLLINKWRSMVVEFPGSKLWCLFSPQVDRLQHQRTSVRIPTSTLKCWAVYLLWRSFDCQMSISWTSLMLAAQLGRLSVCKLLIQNGVKPTLSF